MDMNTHAGEIFLFTDTSDSSVKPGATASSGTCREKPHSAPSRLGSLGQDLGVIKLAAFPGYGVSRDGVVWSCMRRGEWRPLKVFIDWLGYEAVSLRVNGVGKTKRVHALMMLGFVGERPAGAVIAHRNDVKTDNRLVNLRYTTQSENMLEHFKNRTTPRTYAVVRRYGVRRPKAKPSTRRAVPTPTPEAR